MRILSVVIPVFDNPTGPKLLLARLIPILEKITPQWRLLFVDDGTKDDGRTCESLEFLSMQDERIGWISLKENRGQQIALFAGMKTILEDTNDLPLENHFLLNMDDDSGHPPEEIPRLVHEIEKGWDMVYAVPSRQVKRGFLNRIGGNLRDLFFRVALRGPKGIRPGSFRIISAPLVKEITGYSGCKDPSGFIYISALIFQKTKKVTHIEYQPENREGMVEKQSRYSIFKRVGLLLKLILYYTPLTDRLINGHINRMKSKKHAQLFEIGRGGGFVKRNHTKLHILGGSFGQLNIIKRAKTMGLHTIVSDLNEKAPGMLIGDETSNASTFDHEKITMDAKRLGTTALLAAGTDQPVLTAARAAENLGIPYFLTPRTATLVTNKREMKNAFLRLSLPTSPFRIIDGETDLETLDSLSPPLVIKPLDSQGQRGVYKLDSSAKIPKVLKNVLSFSREKEVLIEEYYPSNEVTVTGWVKNREYIHLTVTDRITRDNLPNIGVCPAHHYPSRFAHMENEIISLTKKIVSGFKIPEGPIYFQYLIGEDGIKINETACRLGGAYEDEFIPWLTGVDLTDIMIKMSCNMEYSLPSYDIINENRMDRFISLQMFFYNQGVLKSQKGMEKVLVSPGILGGRFLLQPGTRIENRENSTQRAGYFIASGHSRQEVNKLTKKSFDELQAQDDQGKNLLIASPVLLPRKE
ncbi:MAG: glycosyltransferase [Spirochaetales bacterium]|nr:glycosyltransferase [Spirochaetales bacterium]